MSPTDPHIYFSELASKYLSGNASEEEVVALENWVLADPANKRLFMDMKKAWMLSGMEKQTAAVAVEDLWKATAAQMDTEAKVRPLNQRSSYRSGLRIAAALAFLIICAAVIYFYQPTSTSFTASTTDQIELFELSDGSEVTLNQASQLSYSFNKEKDIREVNLEGDAFFDVAHDEDHPFIITAQGLEIEVLGTSFYVDARSDQPEVQVIVSSGRVAVRYQDQETILEAEEKASFMLKETRLEKVENQDNNYEAIKTNTLEFEATNLNEVAFALNRQYHSNIQLGNEALKDCLLSSTFKDKSLEAILIILESTLGIEVQEENGIILLTGECE